MQVTTIIKKQNLHTKYFTKNKLIELTDCEAGLSDATSTEVSSQNSDEVSGSKAEKRKYHDIWKSKIPVRMFCIVIFAERQAQILLAKPNLLLKKKRFRCESLVFLNKSLKHDMVSAKAHSSTKHLVSHSGHY